MAIQVPKRLKVTIFPKTPKARTIDISIIDVTEMVTFTPEMETIPSLFITYVYEGRLPDMVTIVKAEYTQKVLEEAIRKDIESVYEEKEFFEIP